jgi:hypothetical protein
MTTTDLQALLAFLPLLWCACIAAVGFALALLLLRDRKSTIDCGLGDCRRYQGVRTLVDGHEVWCSRCDLPYPRRPS